MNQSLLAGSELQEGAELFDAHHFSGEDLSRLKVGGDNLDILHGLVHHLLVRAADGYRAVVLNVDLHAGLIDNSVDGLASLAHHIADLLRINVDLNDLGGELADLRPGAGNGLLHHLRQDILSGVLAAGNGLLHNGTGQAVDLDVHLDGGDSVVGSRHLKVHVSEEVFQSLDISEHQIVVIGVSGHQAAGDSCHRFLNRHARSHKGHAGRADRSLGGRAVGLEGLGYRADSVGEFRLGGKHRDQGSLRQGSMSDLPASRTSGGLGLSYGIGGEIVLMHVALAGLIFVQPVQSLCLGQRCQSYHIADLGLSPGKHGGSVDSGDNVHLGRQRTDLAHRPAVGSLVVFENHFADGLLLILVNRLPQHRQPVFLLREGLLQLLGDLADILLTHLFLIGKHGLLHLFRGHDLFDSREQLLGNRAALVGVFWLSALFYDFVNEADDLSVYFMGFIDGLDHLGLRHLVGSGFDHNHLVPGGSHCQPQVRHRVLIQGGVHNQLPVNHADLGGGAGAVKGNVGNAGGNGGTQHGDYLRIALRIHGHNHVVQSHIVAVILGKQRPHGAVDDPGGEDGMLAGLALSLVKAAGDLAYSVHFFLVLHRQGEEINALSGFVRGCGGTQQGGISVMHKRAAVGLLPHSADVYRQGSACQFHGIGLVIVYQRCGKCLIVFHSFSPL